MMARVFDPVPGVIVSSAHGRYAAPLAARIIADMRDDNDAELLEAIACELVDSFAASPHGDACDRRCYEIVSDYTDARDTSDVVPEGYFLSWCDGDYRLDAFPNHDEYEPCDRCDPYGADCGCACHSY